MWGCHARLVRVLAAKIRCDEQRPEGSEESAIVKAAKNGSEE
jgi:hypothetical protein